jgi:HK97 family phage portal protein
MGGMGITSRIRDRRQKQISHRPDLAGRQHLVSQYADQVSAELNQFVDYAQVYQVYAWMRKAITVKANAIAPLPVRVVDRNGKALPSHPVSELLAYVNDEMDSAHLWLRWAVHMDLAGESFFEILDDSRGRPVELWPRRPDQVSVVPDKSPERVYYPTAAGYIWGDDELEIDAEHMIHSRYYNPLNQWRGLAPVVAVREGIVIDIYAQTWSKQFFRNSTRPDFAVVTPQGITPGEKEKLIAQLAKRHRGYEHWHEPVILEEGVTDIKPLSFPPKDLEWLQQREFSRDEVAAMLGVPDEIMGYGRDTYENFEYANRVLWTLTLVPLIGHRDRSLTHYFSKKRPLLRTGEEVKTDLSSVSVLQDDLGPKLEQAGKLWALGVPFNIVDERLGLGIGPIPGGEVGYLPFSAVPAGQGRTALPSDNGGTRQLPAPRTKRAPEFGSVEHKARFDQVEARRQPFVDRMGRELKRQFQRQQNEVLRRLRERHDDEGLVLGWQRAVKASVIPDISELANWPEEIKVFAEAHRQIFEEAVATFGQAQLVELLGAIAIDFDLRNPLVADAIKSMLIQFAQDINATTQQRMIEVLRALLPEAEEGGWGIPQIQREIYERISQVYNVRKADYETERIARTEMLKASNMGSIEGMRQSGVVGRKGWLSALDDRTRTPANGDAFDHVSAHGEEVALNEKFQRTGELLDHPGDPSGSLANIINCRCTVYPVIE